ncbi:MAG: ABC transporter permease [Tissierellia bacterium]|nr:ABC transporter permease [Tissierellia bacterium]
MTRMVDEQRLEIGTLKALGYSNYDIMKKYFIYGGVASLIGGLFGILVGHEIISKLIFDAYAGSYIFTSTRIKYNIFYSIMAILIGFVCTTISAIFAAKSSLEENAAILMRGKPPKSGTRIFLERVKPVWNKLNFMQKVTARNMFRYKKRMFMTILGVSGCTALLFLGLGIQDSIGSIMDKQFGDIYKYNVISIYDEDFGETSYSKYQEMINSDDRIEKSEKVFVDNVDIDNPGGLTQSVMMMVPESNEEFYKLVSLRDRKSQSPVEIKDGGVIINEKLATIYDKKIGDTIIFKDSDMVQYEVVINGITENYSGHNMYMNSSYYDEVFGEKYSPNADLIEFVSPGADENQLLIEDIIANKSIMSVVNMDVTTTFLDDVMGTLDIIVYVIIVCASVLAFVVLYNLTNINISERMRELSTIKVLGFYPKEVTSYVYRETLILTSMGIVVGYLFGFIMHRMIINNLLPDNVMLNPQITIRNLVISAILTLIFSFIVMISVHKKLKDIDMIEALKAVE